MAIGPHTNLALLDEAYPGLLARADLYLMGGHMQAMPVGYPQWDTTHDWNVQYDVTSARHILERCNPTLIPLEVTVQTALCRAHLPALHASGPLGQLLARQGEAIASEEKIGERYGRSCPGLPDDILNFQHDALACAAALGWDGVTVESTCISTEVRDGWLYEQVDEAGKAMRLVTAVEGSQFSELWLSLVTV